MKRPIVAFDVDGTLIDQYDAPRYEIVNLFLFLHEHTNCDLVIWSGGGLDYAEHWART